MSNLVTMNKQKMLMHVTLIDGKSQVGVFAFDEFGLNYFFDSSVCWIHLVIPLQSIYSAEPIFSLN